MFVYLGSYDTMDLVEHAPLCGTLPCIPGIDFMINLFLVHSRWLSEQAPQLS